MDSAEEIKPAGVTSRLSDLLDGPRTIHDVVVTGLREDIREPRALNSHTHADGQLLYAASGVIVVGSESGYWVVPPSRALWLKPGVRHWARMSGDIKLRSVLVSHGERPPLLAESCVLAVTPLMREVISVLSEREKDAPMSQRDSALTAVLMHELDALSVLPVHLPSLRDSRLAAIERHVLKNPDKPLPLTTWAQKLNVDQRTLHRLFVRQTGISYRRWLQQAQLLFALEWLADGQKVIDVADQLGYSSQSAFTVMFRRNLGVTPASFFSHASAGTAS
ncbi:AraC family transcriptional regulator [Paraburkholderia tropica]|uniref:AraC family transcriptional regulator n=1 Tax=Paraburkholderia tropica TaxID=92647 RepID=UPI0007ECEB0B|nr:helix-turn-helix transcriptional regulator [Paraburkholderia tropica]OBR53115.1 hypothetical protein A6456_09125 [Paraburkholderia tropica]